MQRHFLLERNVSLLLVDYVPEILTAADNGRAIVLGQSRQVALSSGHHFMQHRTPLRSSIVPRLVVHEPGADLQVTEAGWMEGSDFLFTHYLFPFYGLFHGS